MSFSYEVLVINPLGLVFLLFLPLLLLSWYGPIDVLPQLRRPRLRSGGLRRAARKVKVERYKEFLRIVVKPSRLAKIYYAIVRSFGFGSPMPSETLREHFSRVSRGRGFGGKIKDLLFRLMVLVEMDLYSRKKPPVEEAEKIAREIRSE